MLSSIFVSILGRRDAVFFLETAVEIGDFTPDYNSNPQKFYDSDLVYLEIYTVDEITNDMFNGNVSSYSTTLSLTVEVIN